MVNNVTKCKFICLMHSEAKQSKTLGLGAEKDSLHSHARKMGGFIPHKTLNSPKGFGKPVLKKR